MTMLATASLTDGIASSSVRLICTVDTIRTSSQHGMLIYIERGLGLGQVGEIITQQK